MQGGAGGEPEAGASPVAPSDVEVRAALCGNRKGRRKAVAPAPKPEARSFRTRPDAHTCLFALQPLNTVFKHHC